jgi:hypothetical protein
MLRPMLDIADTAPDVAGPGPSGRFADLAGIGLGSSANERYTNVTLRNSMVKGPEYG